MAKKQKVKKKNETKVLFGTSELRGAGDSKFSVSSHTLNVVNGKDFPGNISPEGYFYSPFYEVNLREVEDEVQFIIVKRINFIPLSASVNEIKIMDYDPLTGKEEEKNLNIIKLSSPVPYSVILHQPFCIYDVLDEKTYMGYLSGVSGTELTIGTEAPIDSDGLVGNKDPDGKSRYIISLISENAPDYAEFIPSSQKLVWRGPKKMSELDSTSPLYNMPFTNGRNYIHKNLNVFVRRQDPHEEFNLFRPSQENPLRRFQVEGGEKLDFDDVQYIIDSMVDAC